MRRYIMEWDPEKRQVPLQKIMDIFHELGQEEVKCYVLIKPQHKNVIKELKSREDLTFYWEEDLEAYSATGKIHLRQQEENQKENAI